MKLLFRAALLALALAVSARADKLTVTVTNDLPIARPAEVISVPFAQILQMLDPEHADPATYWNSTHNIPKVRFDNLLVKDAAGNPVPSQVTNLDTKYGRNYQYNDLIFQHDFAAGEKSATFTIETVDTQVPPYPSKVYCRYVPDRLDDFAWENDRIAHRIYGPDLEQPFAGPDLMANGGSGIDVWSKRFPYFIIDRWYGKDHNPLHTDTGEGLDMYETGPARGDGGIGIWDGSALHVSRNFRTWKILANGPIRAVFEVGYEPWDAGNGTMVSETKRFTVDAGHNLDQIVSTLTFNGTDELTVGIGLTEHTARSDGAKITPTQNAENLWESLWEIYPRSGQLGTGVVLAPGSDFTGFVQSKNNVPAARNLRPDDLMLVKAKSGVPITYYAGAGWDQSKQFTGNADWTAYLSDWAQRLRSPVKVSVALSK